MDRKIKLQALLVVFTFILVGCAPSRPTPDILATVAAKDVELQLTSEAIQVAQTQLAEQAAAAQEEAAPTEEPPPAPDVPTPTLKPLPTAQPITRERVVAYSGFGLTKLEGLAFVNGIEFTRFTPDQRDAFFEELERPDVAVAIYLSFEHKGLESELLKLAEFVESGGRVLMFYEGGWSASNELLKRLFTVSIAEESVLDTDGGVFFYPPSLLPSYMSGYEVVCPGVVRAWGYLVTSEEGDRGYLESGATDVERLLYFSSADRSVTFLSLVFCLEEDSYAFLDDGSIHFRDNEQAALALLNYLLGR